MRKMSAGKADGPLGTVVPTCVWEAKRGRRPPRACAVATTCIPQQQGQTSRRALRGTIWTPRVLSLFIMCLSAPDVFVVIISGRTAGVSRRRRPDNSHSKCFFLYFALERKAFIEEMDAGFLHSNIGWRNQNKGISFLWKLADCYQVLSCLQIPIL
jgi:hypothetical protein